MNYPNTDVADTAMFGAGDDDTVTSEGEYYQNTTGHPWALDIPGQWSHPYERIDTCEAYEHLTTWAESGGTLQTDWFTSPTGSRVW